MEPEGAVFSRHLHHPFRAPRNGSQRERPNNTVARRHTPSDVDPFSPKANLDTERIKANRVDVVLRCGVFMVCVGGCSLACALCCALFAVLILIYRTLPDWLQQFGRDSITEPLLGQRAPACQTRQIYANTRCLSRSVQRLQRSLYFAAVTLKRSQSRQSLACLTNGRSGRPWRMPYIQRTKQPTS